jgi:tetratricopeptide (TPR) repeat protein
MDAGKEDEEKQEKTPKFEFDTIEMLSEFRGENGSEGQDLLDKGEYYAAIKSFEKDLEKYPKSVYYLFGNGLSLAKLGNHKEATNYYSKVVETSDKYLIEYLPTFEELYEITLKALYEKWRSLKILGEREESAICLNRIRELSELDIFDKDGKILPLRWYSENKVMLYRAKALIRKGYVDTCLNDLEKVSVVYNRSEWQLFADAIKQDKDFQTIVNDERFKKLLI